MLWGRAISTYLDLESVNRRRLNYVTEIAYKKNNTMQIEMHEHIAGQDTGLSYLAKIFIYTKVETMAILLTTFPS